MYASLHNAGRVGCTFACEDRDGSRLNGLPHSGILGVDYVCHTRRTAVRRVSAKHYFCSLSLVMLVLLHAGRCPAETDTMDEGSEHLAAGDWGGKHVRMEVSGGGALLEFDCAQGRIKGRVTLDAEGRFSANGEFAREGFGPRDEDKALKGLPALYIGEVKGESMTLTVTLAETKEQVGTYTLTRGSRGRIWKCH